MNKLTGEMQRNANKSAIVKNDFLCYAFLFPTVQKFNIKCISIGICVFVRFIKTLVTYVGPLIFGIYIGTFCENSVWWP